jgi:hypothetical protein
MRTANSSRKPTQSAADVSGAFTITAADAAVKTITPEFLDYRGIRQMFGITRPLLYRLKDQGLVRSVSLRRRGCVSGKRLWCVDSVRALLRNRIEQLEEVSP